MPRSLPRGLPAHRVHLRWVHLRWVALRWVPLVLAAAVCAQAPSPPPLVTIDLAGPAALRQAFLATNLGNLLGGDAARPVWQTWMAWVEQRFAGDGGPRFAPFRAAVAGYRGAVRIRLWLDGSSPVAVAEAWPDGRTDLETIAAGLKLLAGGAGGRRSEVELTGRKVEVVRLGGEFTLPVVHEGRILALAGARLDAAAARVGPVRPPPPAPRGAAPIRVDVDMRQVAAGTLELYPLGRKFVQETLGVDDWRRLQVAVHPFGPHVRADFTFDFAPAPDGRDDAGHLPGVFGALFPARSTALTGVHALGEPGGAFGELSCDWTRLYEVLLRVVEGDGGAEALNGFVGFDVRKDLVDNLRPGLSFWARRAAGATSADGSLVFPVRDGRSVDQCLARWSSSGAVEEEALRHRGVEIAVRGGRSRRYSAVHGGLLYVAYGDGGLERIKEMLDRATATKEKDTGARMSAALRRTAKTRPPGVNGLGVVPVWELDDSLIGVLLELLTDAMRRKAWSESAGKPVREAIASLRPELERLHLDRVCWYTGAEVQRGEAPVRRLHFRFVW